MLKFIIIYLSSIFIYNKFKCCVRACNNWCDIPWACNTWCDIARSWLTSCAMQCLHVTLFWRIVDLGKRIKCVLLYTKWIRICTLFWYIIKQILYGLFCWTSRLFTLGVLYSTLLRVVEYQTPRVNKSRCSTKGYTISVYYYTLVRKVHVQTSKNADQAFLGKVFCLIQKMTFLTYFQSVLIFIKNN